MKPNSSFLWANRSDVPVENKWRLIQGHIASLLRNSDWTQIPGSPLTNERVSAWASYRQALQNIPLTFEEPDEVVFPEVPT